MEELAGIGANARRAVELPQGRCGARQGARIHCFLQSYDLLPLQIWAIISPRLLTSSGDSSPLFERFVVQSTSITNGRAAKTIKAVPVISQTSIGQASRKKAMLKGAAADDIVSHEIGFGSTMDRLHSEIARLEKELRLTQQQNKELAERLMEAAFSSTEPAIETSPQRPSSPDPVHAGLIRSELTEEGQHSRRRKLPLSQLSDLVAAGL